jgi:hypothetical protein
MPRAKKGQRFGGRAAGVPNKSTANAREAIAAFVDGNTPRLQAWLDAIEATDGPKAAWQCVMDLVEYHVPKLARTEVTGKDGGPVATTVNHHIHVESEKTGQ